MMKNENGFTIVEVLLVLVIVGLMVAVGWLFYDHQKSAQTNDSSIDTIKTANNASGKETTSEPKVSITPYLGEKIELSVPTGWEKTPGDEGKLIKIIGDTKYIINFQITEKDYLKEPAYDTGADQILGTVTTSKGTKLFIIKISNRTGIAVSRCAPSGSTACSLMQHSKPLLISVATPGSQAPGEIDFGNDSISTLISDIKDIAAGLPF